MQIACSIYTLASDRLIAPYPGRLAIVQLRSHGGSAGKFGLNGGGGGPGG